MHATLTVIEYFNGLTMECIFEKRNKNEKCFFCFILDIISKINRFSAGISRILNIRKTKICWGYSGKLYMHC